MAGDMRYRLVRTVATGGMALVYEAVAVGEHGIERRVAIKRILPEHAGDERVRRMFLDEARIASRLNHGGIASVVDYGDVDGSPFLAMEFVDGIDAMRAADLGQAGGTPMPEALALHVCAEVAHALAYAHARKDESGEALGIVHRDVSPQNILLSWDGDVKLSDFGIALATKREEKTSTGIVKGKLSYMPPEQAAGKPVGPAADVYALGATLHVLLAVEVPLLGLAGELRIDPALSEEVADVVRLCMARDAADRPATEAVAYRVGQLAARRLDRDARTTLREWLAPLRSPTSVKRSALDDLMGLALEPLGDGRRYTVSRIDVAATADPPVVIVGAATADRPPIVAPAAAAAVDQPAEDDAPGDSSADDDEEVSSAPALPLTTGRAWAVGALGLIIAALGAVALVVSAGGDSDRSPPREPTDSQLFAGTPRAAGHDNAVRDALENARLPEDEAIVDPSTVDLPPPPDEEVPVDETPQRTGPRPPRPPDEPPVEPAMEEAPDPPADPPSGEGFLRIGRRSAGQERVEVDGAARGFTPTVLRLSAGSHRVVVRDATTGALLSEATVDVGSHHTRVSPLVLPR